VDENILKTAEAINAYLREKLERARCVQGHFACETGGSGFLLTMNGQRENEDKSIFFWDWEAGIKPLARQYLELHDPALAGFSIDIILGADSFNYTPLTQERYHQRKNEEAMENEKTAQASKLEQKNLLAAQTTPYGHALARRVADKLQSGGSLGYSHRDYCGTGLEVNAAGEFCYVELWDGGGIAPVLASFPTLETFVVWLEAQSDASLARLDSPDSFYLGKSGDQPATPRRISGLIRNCGLSF
jgi:hypothetical protein